MNIKNEIDYKLVLNSAYGKFAHNDPLEETLEIETEWRCVHCGTVYSEYHNGCVRCWFESSLHYKIELMEKRIPIPEESTLP